MCINWKLAADRGMTSAPGLSGERWDAFRKHRRETEQQLLKRQGLGEKHAANNQLRDAESRWSLPLELLAKEWLSELPENKTYVIERLLPTLILGMEKLLTEVSDRGLEETENSQYDFNPLNLLGQYLMRNNPLHSNLPHNHPYCNQLQQVSEQLKQESH